MGVPVQINRPPHSASLIAWGRHATGWWGCLVLQVRVVGPADATLVASAWAPAHVIQRPGWSGTTAADVPRLELPAAQADWPAPPRARTWYVGSWADGELPMPPGVEMVAGAAWRKRPPRGASGGSS